MNTKSPDKKLGFSQSAKIRLIERGQTITEIAKKLGYDRASVSLVIHQRRKMSGLENDLRKELGIPREQVAA